MFTMPEYVLGHHRITSDVIDNEAVIVDLDQGIYFSCNRSGSFIWAGLLRGDSVADLIPHLLRSQAAPTDDVVRADVALFVERLHQFKLLRTAAATDVDATHALGTVQLDTYESPTLDPYTDLQDLLVLDPIHDVTEAGWPKRT